MQEGKGKETGKGKKDNGEAKGNAKTDYSYFASVSGYCGKWSYKKAQCRKQKRDQGGKPPTATVQAVVMVSQIQSFSSDDSFWVFAVSASSGRNARILVDSGADEHVCPTDFASATPLGPTKDDMTHSAMRRDT